MELKGSFGIIYKICDWIMFLVYVNFLWIIFSFCGLLIGGIAPATAAMFSVIRKRIMGDDSFSVLRIFKQEYKTMFLKANGLLYLLTAIGGLLYVDLAFIQPLGNGFFRILGILTFILILLYIVILLYVFPLFVHYEMKLTSYLKGALIIGLTYPFYTIMMLFLITILFLCAYVFQISTIFFGASVTGFIVMFISNKVFTKIDVLRKV